MADLAPVLAAPADDAPRLVYADQVGGERGELIVVQCTLAAGGLPRARELALRRRERELLARHRATWADLPAGVLDFEFRRGFVERVTVDGPWLQRHAGVLALRAPLLRHLELIGLRLREGEHPDTPAEFLGLTLGSATFPALDALTLADLQVERLREFAMTEEWVGASRSDEVPEALATLGLLQRVRALELAGLSRAGVASLLEHPDAAGLEAVSLSGSLGTRNTKALLRRHLQPRPTRLRVIDVPRDAFRQPGAFENAMEELVEHPLLSRVVDLEVRHLRAEPLRALLSSPVATRLRRLAVAVSLDERTLELLLESPALRGLEELCLRSPPWPTGERPGPEGAPALALFADPTTLPALRVLRLNGVGLTDELAEALVASPRTGQLLELDLRANGNWLSGTRAHEWRAQTDTELRVDPPVTRDGPGEPGGRR